jgi:hypothetical protein
MIKMSTAYDLRLGRKRIPVMTLALQDSGKVRVLNQRTARILEVDPSELVEPQVYTSHQRRMIRQGMREQVRRGHW